MTIQATMHWDVYTTIDKIVQALKGKKIKISFTGGEPFVNLRFVDMLNMPKRMVYTDVV